MDQSTKGDDYSVARVPSAARLPMWEILIIRFGTFATLSQFILGAALGYGMEFFDAFLALIIGTIILEALSLLIGIAGAKEGMSASLLARWTGFGKYGSGILGFVIAIALTGWFGIQNSVFAKGINESLGGVLGFPVTALITGLLVTLLVMYGLKWIRWTAKIAVPAFLLLMGYSAYQVLEGYSIGDLLTSPAPGPLIPIGVPATMVTGSWVIGVIITPDMTRYCRNGKDVLWTTLISTFLGEVGIGSLAILMAHAAKSSDVISISTQLVGWIGVAIVIFSTIKINNINLYSSSLGLANLFDTVLKTKMNRGKLTLILGVIGSLLSVFHIEDNFQGFLVFLGVWIPPIAGIIIIDYFILKRYRADLEQSRAEEKLPENYENINVMSILAWIAGFVVGYFVTSGIPAINSMIASAVVYYMGSKLFPNKTMHNQRRGENTNC